MVFILHTVTVHYYCSLSLKHQNTWVVFTDFLQRKQSINGKHYTQCHLLAKTQTTEPFYEIIYKFRLKMLVMFYSHGANNYITLSLEI